MSLYPFPPRSELPPRVPPKPPRTLPPLDCNVGRVNTRTTQSAPGTDMRGRKRTMPSVSKMTSFDSLKDLRGISPSKRREVVSPSNKQSTTKLFQVTLSSPPPERMQMRTPPPVPAVQTSPQSTSRLANAKQRAKDVWKSRRQGSKSDIDTTITEPLSLRRQKCLDSPTIPEIYQGGEKQGTGWRHVVFGDAMVSVNSTESEERIAGFLSQAARPAQSFSPRSQSPFVTNGNSLPGNSPTSIPGLSSTISGAVKALQSPPTFLQKTRNFTPPPPTVYPVRTFRPRSDSLPVQSRPLPTVSDAKQPTRPGSADSATVKPLNIPEKAFNPTTRHRRKKSSISGAIPHGIAPADVNSLMVKQDYLCIREQAKEKAQTFRVLSQRDWEAISLELSQLDSRIEYLRNTRASLRAGRRTLHTRMITFLRSSRTVAFSQESLLKQEEALAELDVAIEEWECKLERAERRRGLLKDKLLQHVAATLAVPRPRLQGSKRDTQDTSYTPPATPDNERSSAASSKYDRNLESITIYASLADVKQEIERIVKCVS